MRLWHYKLIPVLPNKMLISQWRECIAIKRQWEKGTLKHPLIKYVMNYNKKYFISYVADVYVEALTRGIKIKDKYYNEILDFCNQDINLDINNYYSEHNNRYLTQCFYNLQEKYDRGIITSEEWNLINKNIGGEIDEKHNNKLYKKNLRRTARFSYNQSRKEI